MKELIKSSLVEDNFSSNMHGISAVKVDIPEDDFVIPQRYFVDRVTLLPVNLNKYFIYWEITKELKQKYKLIDDKFVFKIYDSSGNFLTQFEGEGEVGDYYLYRSFEEPNLKIVMGFEKEQKFIKLIESNYLCSFSDKISFATEQESIWMTKERGWRELIKSSIDGDFGYSSDKFLEEFSKYQKIRSSGIE